MLRRFLLVLMAAIVSFGLTAIAGYVLYINSGGRSEAYLSSLVRIFLDPLIAALVGVLVGILSKDRAVPVTILGLLPWALVLLLGAFEPLSAYGLMREAAALVLLPLSVGAIAAELAARIRRILTSRPLRSA
jgi:hypothetical protein